MTFKPRPDPFTLLMLATVALATVLPCRGPAALWFGWLARLAIGALFFLHGAKLSRAAILAGIGHWRLHLAVLATTFGLFPLLGLALAAAPAAWIEPSLAQGFLFLCLLPSTVQSSIAFTSIAGGNVPAAVAAASASNLIGIFVTPLLVGATMGLGAAGGTPEAVWGVVEQLLLPFLAGHAMRPLIGRRVDRHKAILGRIDRGSILLVVYTAFSAAVVEGLWHRLSAGDFLRIVAVALALLLIVLAATTLMARRLGFGRGDQVVLVFCGSKKSLASGVPMAGALFPAAAVGTIIMPLMLFHQLQLMICGALAGAYAGERDARPGLPTAGERLAEAAQPGG